MKRNLIVTLLTVGALALGFSARAKAHSEASVVLSALPVASVVVTGTGVSAAVGASVVAPVAILASSAVLLVKAIEVTARGTVYVLERASDGARLSIEVIGKGAHQTSLAMSTAVAVSAIGSGYVLSAASQAIAFIPNELGRALLHNERVSR